MAKNKAKPKVEEKIKDIVNEMTEILLDNLYAAYNGKRKKPKPPKNSKKKGKNKQKKKILPGDKETKKY